MKFSRTGPELNEPDPRLDKVAWIKWMRALTIPLTSLKIAYDASFMRIAQWDVFKPIIPQIIVGESFVEKLQEENKKMKEILTCHAKAAKSLQDSPKSFLNTMTQFADKWLNNEIIQLD